MSPLAKKLRLAPNHRFAILNSPPGFLAQLQPGPTDLHVEVKGSEVFDAVLLFVSNVEELRALGPDGIRCVAPGGLLWITYPKGGVARGGTDLPATPWWTKRDVLGEVTGVRGYKPVAMIKVDDTWTAMRFKQTE